MRVSAVSGVHSADVVVLAPVDVPGCPTVALLLMYFLLLVFPTFFWVPGVLDVPAIACVPAVSGVPTVVNIPSVNGVSISPCCWPRLMFQLSHLLKSPLPFAVVLSAVNVPGVPAVAPD